MGRSIIADENIEDHLYTLFEKGKVHIGLLIGQVIVYYNIHLELSLTIQSETICFLSTKSLNCNRWDQLMLSYSARMERLHESPVNQLFYAHDLKYTMLSTIEYRVCNTHWCPWCPAH